MIRSLPNTPHTTQHTQHTQQQHNTHKPNKQYKALIILANYLRDPSLAENYCKKHYNSDSKQEKDMYLFLLQIYLTPAVPPKVKIKTRVHPPYDRMQAAHNLLSKHYRDIDPCKALQLLPDRSVLHYLLPFFQGTLSSHIEKRRKTQVSNVNVMCIISLSLTSLSLSSLSRSLSLSYVSLSLSLVFLSLFLCFPLSLSPDTHTHILHTHTHTHTHTHNQPKKQIVQNLLKAELFQVRKDYFTVRSHFASIDRSTVCGSCGKWIGKSAFVRTPTGLILHSVCFILMSGR